MHHRVKQRKWIYEQGVAIKFIIHAMKVTSGQRHVKNGHHDRVHRVCVPRDLANIDKTEFAYDVL